MSAYGVRIVSTGSYIPERVVTNLDLERMVDTSDEWIQTRTGIRERHVAAEGEATSDMAAAAGRTALERAGVAPEDLDLIIVATLSPDTFFPNTACYVQKKIGAGKCASFSIEAACCGFLYSLDVAANMLRSGGFRNALVIGAEKISMHVDWTDRTTCVLFGDGAGAVLLERVPADRNTFLASSLGADGNYTHLLQVPAGGSAMPITHEAIDQRSNTIKMAGRETFKLAVNAMAGAAEEAMRRAGVTIDEVRWLVPHQANRRIIAMVGQRLHIPEERVYMNLDRYGNTSAASIPIAFDEIVQGGLIAPGDTALFVAFGGGLTWAAAVVRW